MKLTFEWCALAQDDWDRAVERREKQRSSSGNKKPHPKAEIESNQESKGGVRLDGANGTGQEEKEEERGAGGGWGDEEEAEEMLLACNIGGKNSC